jgi:hypothetical protein
MKLLRRGRFFVRREHLKTGENTLQCQRKRARRVFFARSLQLPMKSLACVESPGTIVNNVTRINKKKQRELSLIRARIARGDEKENARTHTPNCAVRKKKIRREPW